jgi:hypothetical protein
MASLQTERALRAPPAARAVPAVTGLFFICIASLEEINTALGNKLRLWLQRIDRVRKFDAGSKEFSGNFYWVSPGQFPAWRRKLWWGPRASD